MLTSIGTDLIYINFTRAKPKASGWCLVISPDFSDEGPQPARVYPSLEEGDGLLIQVFGSLVFKKLNELEGYLFAPLSLQQGSNFFRVSGLNELFSKPKGCISHIDWASVSNQLSLIQEEVAELSEAVEVKDIQEIRDGICDTLVTTYGLGHLLGVPVDEDMKAVDASNRSKICMTPAQLKATERYYREAIGIEVFTGGVSGAWWVKSSADQVGLDDKHYPRNKFLKCVDWRSPVFAPLSPPSSKGLM